MQNHLSAFELNYVPNTFNKAEEISIKAGRLHVAKCKRPLCRLSHDSNAINRNASACDQAVFIFVGALSEYQFVHWMAERMVS